MRRNQLLVGLLAAPLFFSTTTAKAQEEKLPVVADHILQGKDQGARSAQAPPAARVPLRISSRAQQATAIPGAGPDVLVNNNNGILGTGAGQFTQSESSVIAFGNNVVVSYNDAGSAATAGGHFTGWSYSTDGGATFTDGGVLPNSVAGDAGDPVLARNNSTGRIYLLTLGFNNGNVIQVFRSDNNGVSWQPPVNGTPGGSSEDKPWIAVDNFAGAGNGNVYILSRRFGTGPGIYFFRSTDNGSTFGPNGGTLLVSGQQGAYIVVGPDHSIYAFWFNGATIQMRKSTDQGLTFAPAVTVVSGLVGGTNGDLALTGIRQGTAVASGFRSSEFPHAAVNPVTGQLYVVVPNNPAGADKADVFITTSTNGGATWSAPARVNDDATTTDQWQPTIHVTNDGLRMGIFYYSRQEDAVNNNLYKYYGRIADVSGAAINYIGPSFAVSDVASLPEFGRDNVINAVYMGDYNTVSSTPGFFHIAWSDNRDDLPVGAPRKDPNMYYKKVPAQNTLAGPNITVVPLAVNFGDVLVGQTAGPTPVSLTNIGDQPLTITSISAPGGDFALSGVPALPLIIPSLGTVQFNVSLTPTSPGPKSGTIIINSNALNNPVVNVSLQGFGKVPTTITVAPSPLVVNLPYSGSGSGVFNISNPAFADNLNWVINDLDKPYVARTSNDPGGPVFNWVDISGTGTPVTLGDDAVSASIPLPFTFPFFGQNKTAAFISSNGLLAFTSAGATAFTNASIPTAAAPNDFLAPFWDDLNPAAGGTIHYHSTPTQFVVQYTNVQRFTAGSSLTFQVILNADGSMLFQYLTMTGVLNSATIGIEDAAGATGLQLAFNQAFVQNNLAVRFAAPPVAECAWITSITPSSGSTPGGASSPVTVGVNATGLNCGTYNCNLTIKSNATNAPTLVLPVVLNVAPAFTCSIVSVPSNNVYTGGVPTNLYLGYGPQSTTLQSTVAGPGGPFTYAWSPAAGLSNTTSSAPVFTPTTAGTYNFTLTVTGAGGCATTCNITINVYDIRVPGNSKKVYICHAPPGNPDNAHTLAISVNAVESHLLNHADDRLGQCGQVSAAAMRPIIVLEAAPQTNALSAYPNPSTGQFAVPLPGNFTGQLTVRVLNRNGAVMEHRIVNNRGEGQVLQFDLSGKAAGLYLVQVTGKDGTKTVRLLLHK